MKYNSYTVSDTETAISLPLACPPPYSYRRLGHFGSKRKAFTLAETLITLTIIGVIAAITVPTLLSKYQKHTYVVGLKKAYSELSNAMKMIPLTENCPAGDYECVGILYKDDYGYWWDDFIEIKLLAKQLKGEIITDAQEERKKCAYPGYRCFVTPGGMTVTDNNSSSGIYIDLNGEKGPNKFGRDRFCFVTVAPDTASGRGEQPGFHYGTIMPCGSKALAMYFNNDNYYWRNRDCVVKENTNVYWPNEHCTGRVLEENEMNY